MRNAHYFRRCNRRRGCRGSGARSRCESGGVARVAGLEPAQLDAIKAEIFAKAQFVGQLVESATRWEVEAGEIRLYFPTEQRALADLLQARDNVEKLRTIASRVLGQPLRYVLNWRPLRCQRLGY